MSLDRFISKLLLFCIPLYFTQGWLFGSGSTVSQILIGIWLMADFYYLVCFYQKPFGGSVSNAVLVFWIVNLIYWVVSPKEVRSFGLTYPTFGDFKNLTTVMLSFFPVAVLTKRGVIDDGFMRRFFVLFLGAAIVAYLTKQEANLVAFGDIVTNNTAYYFAVLLPFLGFFFGKKGFWIGYIIILVFLLLCAKRGALLLAVVSLLVYLIVSFKSSSSKNRLSRIFSISLLLALISIVAVTLYSSSDLLQSRMLDTQEGNLSERDTIYRDLWSVFFQSSFIEKIFGHGMSQTVPLIGGYAHNDWLELLTNEGVFGVSLYAAVFLSFFTCYRRYHLRTMKPQYRFLFLSALLCFLARSAFSMGYLAPESALFCIAMAYGQTKK